jgi:cell division septum initiation protein DivIVA
MIGIHKISACIKGEKTKMESMQESIQQLFEIVNLYENKDTVSVHDLNEVIDDVRESFQIFLNNTPRPDEDLKTEINNLKSELAELRELIATHGTIHGTIHQTVVEEPKAIIELDNTMIVNKKTPLPKLNLVKKTKTFSI